MEESLSYKKRIKTFTKIAAAIHGVLSALLNFTNETLEAHYTAQETEPLSQFLFYLPKIILAVVMLSLFFMLGKKLTKDNRKAVLFMGAIYFGAEIVNIFTVYLTVARDLLPALGYFTETTVLILTSVIPVITIPLTALAANFAFTAFEGLHPKLSGNRLDNSQMSLSRAKSRYVGYELIGGFVVGLISSIPLFIAGFLMADNFTSDNNETLLENIVLISGTFAGTMSFAVMYLAGYKPYKNHIDGIAFIACSNLGGNIGIIFTNILYFIQNNIFPTSSTELIEEANGLEAIGSLASSTAFSGISVFIPLVITVFIMKYFFSNTRITLFSETE